MYVEIELDEEAINSKIQKKRDFETSLSDSLKG